MAVVNEGIGSNQVVGPSEYSPSKPFGGGPSALSRLDRDVLGLSGVTHVIWLEGINDLGTDGGASFEQVRDGIRAGVKRIRDKIRGVKVIGATLTSAVGTSNESKKPAEVEQKRRALNDWIRSSGNLFDGVVDFDKATLDPRTGELRPEFVPASTVGGPGDKLHPNRAGYMAMGDAIDLRLLRRPEPPKPRPRPAAPSSAGSDDNG
jgi:lysophospholipase L1-like esterase